MAGVNQGGGKESEWRIVLVGKSGSGRSATGNTILGRKEFKSTLGIQSTTLTCQSGQGSWKDQAVSVVDTADIFSSRSCSKDLLGEIDRCIDLSKPGPHTLVFVTQVGRFTAEDEAAANRVLDVFGAEAARHMVVLFTRREDLGGESLKNYIYWSNNKAVLALIKKCGDRVCAFNNRAVGAEREQQVSELMEMVGKIVQVNGGHYVKKLYLEPSLSTPNLRSLIGVSKSSGCRTCVAIFVLVAVGLALALCLGPFLVILVLAAPFLLVVWLLCRLFRVFQ